MISVWVPADRSVIRIRNGTESPSRNTELFWFRSPFTQSPDAVQAVFGTGSTVPTAHWSRFAAGAALAAIGTNTMTDRIVARPASTASPRRPFRC